MILLTDAEPTIGKNPFLEAAKTPLLDILLFPGGNEWVAEKLIFEAGKGNLYKINSLIDLPEIIGKLFQM